MPAINPCIKTPQTLVMSTYGHTNNFIPCTATPAAKAEAENFIDETRIRISSICPISIRNEIHNNTKLIILAIEKARANPATPNLIDKYHDNTTLKATLIRPMINGNLELCLA